ncbi:MAG: CotH kinase family protein [Bacteroidaceae bacterium]|nr:CotH kinase family protein [Bacteroidaceae bacterium]
MDRTDTLNLRASRLMALALLLSCAFSLHAQEDYTSYIPGAYYSESMASNWTKTPASASGTLQCDTWSGRGSKDGTDFTTPIMEVHIDTWNGVLGTQSVRHQTISNLPRGRYELQMTVRCYAEDGYADPTFSVWLNANDVQEPIVADESDVTYTRGTYNGQVWGLNTASVVFDVDESGTLSFGLDINQQDHQNWVAWKNIHLYLLERYEETGPTVEAGDPATAGTYYIRNRATGRFIAAGSTWGTAIVTGAHGIETTFTPVDNDGNFFLDSGYLQADGRHQWSYYASHGRYYVESGADDYTFCILANADGYYTIQTQDGTYFNDAAEGEIAVTQDATLQTAQWELLTRAEMTANLLSGTQTDATFLITNAHIDQNYTKTGWEGDPNYQHNYDNSTGNGGSIIEAWNTNFNVYQTLTNIPNGRYQLTCQGFYRWNNNDWNNTNANSSRATTNQLYAKLYANDQSTSLRNIASETNLPYGMKDTSTQGANLPYSALQTALAFNAGYYSGNTVEVTVTDHTLTLGVKKEQHYGCDWTTFDNFELVLLSLGDNTDYDPNASTEPDDEFANASPDNPIDLTSRITNPNYSKGNSGWNGGPTTGGMGSNPCAEKFDCTFDVNQTLTGLPNGWYRITAQGYYRYGDYKLEEHKGYNEGGWGQNSQENDANNIYAVYTIPYAVLTHRDGNEKLLAKMYANNVETPLPSIFDGLYDENPNYGNFVRTDANVNQLPDEMIGWIPNDMNSGSYAFNEGKYPIEMVVPVTDGTLKIGVRKDFGYKYDWSMWDNWHLYYIGKQDFQYAEDLSIDSAGDLTLCVGETRQLTATVLPADASDKSVKWTSGNTSIATVDANGVVKAKATGNVTITARANGGEDAPVLKSVKFQVNSADGDPSVLIINEIMVSNLDMFVDPSNNYGGYVELYNPTDQGVSLNGLKVRPTVKPQEYSLNSNSGVVPPHGYGLIWFDHRDAFDGNVGDHLDMDGGTLSICNSSDAVVLSQAYPAGVSRTSYARTTDGGSEWAFTAYPTPGRSNSESDEYVSSAAERLPEPETSYESRLFDSSFTLNVTIPEGATLRYTTNGTTPTEESQLSVNGGQFDISETTILRLRLFKSGMLPSPVKTLSFIQRDKNYMLPVVSLVGNPDDFFSDEMGIFTTGTQGIAGSGIGFRCNWNMEWDRPAAFNYISADGSETYSQEINVKRFGGWSRSWYPFNFKMKASSLYEGRKYVEYPFFGNKPYIKQKVLQMRNGGNDLQCRIKDAALQNIIISSGFYLDCQDYMPVHSFINGKYQGMLNLREPSNKHFSLANYGIDTDEVDQMELGGGVTVNAGDKEAFKQWQNLSSSASDEATYNQIKEMVDVDEFINYMATQMFLGGDDWPGNNCKAFKGHDGKFHIVLFDIDQALRFNAYAFTHITNNSSCPLVSIFLNMLNNDDFRKQFIDTYSIVAGSVFEPTRSLEIIDRIAAEMEPALALEGASTEPTAGYMRALMTESRRNTMMTGLQNWNYANLTGKTRHEVKLSANIEGATLRLNGIDIPTAKFDGTMFSPAVLTASAPEGYVFRGWQDTEGNVVADYEALNIDSWGDLTLTAVYERLEDADDLFADIATPIKVNEVSAGNTVFVNEYFNRNDWFELYNPTESDINVAGLFVSNDINNPLKYQIPSTSPVNTIVPAKGHIVIWADELAPVSQLHANFKLENIDNHIVVVTSSDEFVSNNSEFFSNHPSEFQAFVDGLTYVTHRGDNTVGRYPDGGRDFYRMARPTIDQTNTLTQADECVGHDVCLMDPDANKFRLELVEGWNWTSHNLQNPIAAGALSDYAERIVGERQETIRDQVYGMTGALQSLTAGHLYKVKMSQDDTYEFEGLKCNTGTPVQLKIGWNWIGYTVTGAQSLSEALANNLLENGDHIVGQDGFATYNNGNWTGTLTQLETGKGYMFKSKSAKTLRFHAPGVQVNFSKRRARANNTLHQQFGINKYAYPNVMGMVAQLMMDGTPVDADRFTLLAYVGDECRGMAEAIDHRLFLTLYGEGGERLHYRAIDKLDGAQYGVEESDAFASNVVGSLESPRLLTLTLDTDDATGIDSPIADNPQNSGEHRVVGYYSLDGVLMGSRAATLSPGLYLVKYADGTCEKLLIP